jgi:hypothetical protein
MSWISGAPPSQPVISWPGRSPARKWPQRGAYEQLGLTIPRMQLQGASLSHAQVSLISVIYLAASLAPPRAGCISLGCSPRDGRRETGSQMADHFN